MLITLLIALAMASSSSSDKFGGSQAAKSVLAVAGNKTVAAKILTALQKDGLLRLGGEITEKGFKRAIAGASKDHCDFQTPYGKVVQELDLGPGLSKWEYCNPLAFIYYLSTISVAFSDMMRQSVADASTCRIVIYVDELCPGNPFRPEKGRTLQCIYWCMADWPQWLLQRTFAWPVLGVIRSNLVEHLPGALSYVMRRVLDIFWAADRPSFATGVHICHSAGAFIMKAVFAGFLADLEGHREITRWKGSAGKRCCLSCKNVINMRSVLGDGDVNLLCSDCASFQPMTNERVFAIHDQLAAESGNISNAKFEALQTQLGFTFCPDGILGDMRLRSMYRPVDHAIRDWMHTLVGDGVANSCISGMLHDMKDANLKVEQVQTFSMLCQLPAKYGKVSDAWFAPRRLRDTTIASFASIVLSMVPILVLFIRKFDIREVLPSQVECFEQLHIIIGLFRLGAEGAVRHADQLRARIAHFHALFANVWPVYARPKLHHLHHVLDGMAFIGKLLSCFVTERKHRETKMRALHVFRHMEHTVVRDMVHSQCEQFKDGIDLFRDMFLVRPTLNTKL